VIVPQKLFPLVSTLFAVQLGAGDALAHNNFELDVTGGYRFGSSVKLLQEADGSTTEAAGQLKMNGGFAFSAIAGYRAQPDGFIYLSYSRQQSRVDYEMTSGAGSNFSTDASLEYFQFGGNVEMTRGIVVPYLGFSLGLARFASLGTGTAEIFFAPVFDTGFKVDLHEHIHLRFLGRVPVVFVKGDTFCSEGVGCLKADNLQPMAQLELHGGIGVSF